MSDTPLLQLRGITKTFGSVEALTDVDFEVRAGEVMALVGDNGAGKSTLIKCIAGTHAYDSGQILFEGREVHIHGPKDAARLGIEVVYQDLALCDNLDVVQNMYLGRETNRFQILNEAAMEHTTASTLKSLAVTTISSIRQPVATLSGGQRQSVAVAKAVQWNSKLVILDEPTAALGVAQTEQVLALVRRLGEQGLAVVIISHNLHDIFETADRITVLRLGRNVGIFERRTTTQQTVVAAITAGVPDEGLGHPVRAGSRRRRMTSVDVVGPDGPQPAGGEELPGGLAGLYHRARFNLRTGNLGPVPIIVGQLLIVVLFGLTATNFFTAVNFTNLINQMAGTAMLAFGVVFVLLLGEIDLSIGYLAGIGALTVAELQLPGSGHQLNGIIAMVLAVGVCALIGAVQGSIVAFVGVPSFVVTLGGFLIWQGVILNQLEQRGTIIIQDRWINYTDSYAFSHFAGYLIAAIITALYPLSILYKRVAARGTQIARVNWTSFAVKTAGLGVAAFGTVAIANHGKVIATSLGLPLSGVIIILFFILLTFLAKWTTFGRHVYAVGGNAEAARRAGINVPRIRVLVFVISGATAGLGGIIFASQVNSVALTFPPGNLLLNAIAAAVIGGVSLFGGRGEVRGALLGAVMIGTLQNGLNTLNVSNGWIYIITGLVLLLAVTLDTFAVRLQARSGR